MTDGLNNFADSAEDRHAVRNRCAPFAENGWKVLFRLGKSGFRRDKANPAAILHQNGPDTFPKHGSNQDVGVQNQ